MATHKGPPYLREHREARDMSAEDMGDKVGMERESVYRVEREPWRLDTGEKRQQWANALGKQWKELLSLPNEPWAPSIDKLIEDKPVEVQQDAYELVKTWLKRVG